MDILIKNERITDSDKEIKGSLLIETGKIKQYGDFEYGKKIKTIDGRGHVLMPSFIDTHAHFREPGYEYKENIKTGSMAAAKGGYTAVLLMGNTNPVCDSGETITYILDKGKEAGLVEIIQAGTITRKLEGNDNSHLEEISQYTSFITDDGKGVMNDKIMYDTMIAATKKNMTVISHCENHYFSDTDMRLAENMMTFRDIELARITGCRIHFAHVSTKEAVKRIIEAKEEGLNITFEITPHHIFGDSSVKYRVNPPLRKKEDMEVLIKALTDGSADAVGTDHAPHSMEDKKKGSPGISGIETAFAVCNTVLVKSGKTDLKQLSAVMSEGPARILGLKKGKIEKGYDGDVVLVDPDDEYFIDSEKFVSKGKNTPFDGRKVYGKVLLTIRKGKIVYTGEEYDS